MIMEQRMKMKTGLLKSKDHIGLISPSHIAVPEQYEKIIRGIEEKGFIVKTGKNIYRATWGYLAATQERADDLNDMVRDDEVAMIFFGGGTGSVPVLPFIDYENIKRNPKIFLSYSDGTSILNAVYFQTGLEAFYGLMPGAFEKISEFDYAQFTSHFLTGDADSLRGEGGWKTICSGTAEGILVGGYLENVALEMGSRYFDLQESKSYILFLEDHERFHSMAEVDMYLSHIEQNRGMSRIKGLLFGHYSDETFYAGSTANRIFELLERFGKRHGIPVAYCDDFGHGTKHAILPIGRMAAFDAGRQILCF